MRSVLTPVTVAAVCCGLGVVCIWEVWKIRVPFDDYLEVLVFFVFGVLFGLIGGVVLGRALWSACVRSRRGIAFILPLAVVNVLVFTLLGKPLPTQNADASTLWISVLLPVLVSLLLALNGCLLGLLIVPGRFSISWRRRLVSLALLYTSILVGVHAGFGAHFWQRGVVALDGPSPSQPAGKAPSWKEALASLADWFPPEITSEEKVEPRDVIRGTLAEMEDATGEIRLSKGKPVWVEKRLIVLQADKIVLPRYSPAREVIEATGPVVTTDGIRVECHGYAMIPPDLTRMKKRLREEGPEDEYRAFIAGKGSGATFWALDGEQLDILPGAQDIGRYRGPWSYVCMFVLSFLPKDVRLGGGLSSVLTQLPWNLEWAAGPPEQREGYITQVCGVPLPVPGPAEFRVSGFMGNEKEYVIPAREGSLLTLDTNLLYLARIYPWPFTDIEYRSDNIIGIEFADEWEMKHMFHSEAYTTAVFCCALGGMTLALQFEPILDTGESPPAEPDARMYPPFLIVRFKTDMTRIREFRVRELPGQVEIRYSIPKLQGFPPENENITNRLDILFPLVDLRDEIYLSRPRRPGVGSSKADALFRRYLERQFHSEGLSRFDAPSRPHENVTIRDLLNYYYPGAWWVSDGRVWTTANRFGVIGDKVSASVRALREGS